MGGKLRTLLQQSRKWSKANRDSDVIRMAAETLSDIAQTDSGFVISVPNPARLGPNLVGNSLYATWGVFERQADLLHQCLPEGPFLKFLPFLEQWMVAEHMPEQLQFMHHTLGVSEFGAWPLMLNDRVTGILVAAITRPSTKSDPIETPSLLMEVCTAQISVTLESRQDIRALEEASYHDALTGLLNRRGLEQRFQQLTNSPKPTHRLVFGIFDVDNLKVINDTEGHPAGDEVLRDVANVILMHTRSDDIAARLGGDEFVVVLHAASADPESILRRIQRAVEAHGYSVSIGGAVFGIDGDSLEACYRVADGRMYECKRGSRSFTSTEWISSVGI